MSGSNPFATSGRKPAAGDIVVTKVGDRYHIGRVAVDGDAIAAIEIVGGRSEAITFACTQVSGNQRVIIYNRASSRHHIEVPCPRRHE